LGDKSLIQALLVEDDPAQAAAVREMLARDLTAAFRSIHAQRLSDALALLRERPFDVALLSLGLEDSTGLATYELVHHLAPELPVIVLAGTWDEQLAMKAVQAGAQDYLLKTPLGLESLGRAIRYAIERQSNRQALTASEQRFRALTENSADAVALVAADGRILYASPSAERVSGYAPTAMVGHAIREFLRTTELAMRADLMVQLRQTPRRLVTAEFELRQSDGSWRGVEATVNNLLDDPAVQAIVVNYHDLSNRQQAERSRQRFELLATHSRDIILFMRRVDGQILEANEAAVAAYGYSRQELLSLTISDLRAPETQGTVSSQLEQADRADSLFATVDRRKDGRTFPVEVNSAGVTLNGERVLLNIVRDYSERQRAAQALRENELHLHVALAGVDIAVFNLDRDLRYTWMYNAPLGYTAAQVLGRTDAELLPPDDAAPTMAIKRRVLESGQGERAEVPVHGPTGTHIYDLFVEPLRDKQGAVIGVTGASLDITERRQAEGQRAHLAAIVESSEDAIIGKTLEGLIISWNGGAEQQYGYSAQEIIGQSVALLIPLELASELPDILARLARGEHIRHLETERVHKDGRRLAVSVSISPIVDATGQIVGASTIARDITDRIQAVARLALQSAALDAAANGIVITDLQGQIVWVNPAFTRLTGYSADEVVGRKPSILKSGQHAPSFYATLWATILAGRVWHGEIINRRKDGSLYVEEETITPVWDGRGHLQHFIAIEQDITERKQAEAAVIEQRVMAEALHDTATALNSTLELDELFRHILENVGRVVPHDGADIRLLVSWAVRAAGARTYAERDTRRPALDFEIPFEDFKNTKVMAATGQALAIPDTLADPDWVVVPSREWERSYVGAPIRVKGQILGYINLTSATPGFFTTTHADRLQAFANQAGAALDNARVLAEERRRLAEFEVVNKVSVALRSAQTLDEMLPLLLDEILAYLGAEAGTIWLHDEGHDSLRQTVARGWLQTTGGRPALSLSARAGLGAQVFATDQPYLSREFASDPLTNEAVRPLIPAGWGGALIPIRSVRKMVGILHISVQLPRELLLHEIHVLMTLGEIAGNAIERTRLHEQTEQRLERLAALHAIDLAISSTMSLPITLSVLLDQIMTQLQTDAADIWLLNADANVLEYAAGRGFRDETAGHPSLPVGQGYASQVVLERCQISRPDLTAVMPDPGETQLPPAEAFQAYYGVPLIAKGQVVGVLEVFQRAPLQPDPDWLEFLKALAGQAAIAIDDASLVDRLQRSNHELTQAYDATIEGWTRALDLRDHETEGHSQRVTVLTLELAVAMGMQAQQLEHIRRGALLHDIGKMGVPDNILLKPGPLTSDEWVAMRQHPTLAYQMLLPIPYLRPALDIPYSHHEKWDGSGYPRGLKGEDIPLAARIFAVVDVWDALSANRPYRPAWPEAQVRAHIHALAGTQFDPRVVAAFEGLLTAEPRDPAAETPLAEDRPG
jgi:PAS domain S-box-containing protein